MSWFAACPVAMNGCAIESMLNRSHDHFKWPQSGQLKAHTANLDTTSFLVCVHKASRQREWERWLLLLLLNLSAILLPIYLLSDIGELSFHPFVRQWCVTCLHTQTEMVAGWVGVGGWCAGASMSWHCSCCNTAPQTPPMSTTRTDSDITKVLLTHWHCCSVSPSLQLNFVSVCVCILAGIISLYSYSISSCSPFLFSYLLCFVPALSSWC